MKKYKLIKEYPGSWVKDTIFEFINNSDRCLVNGISSLVPAMSVINFPEFWEEIVEKQPLFTTEDGIDVFEGDYWYIVYIDGYDGSRSLFEVFYSNDGSGIPLNLDRIGIKRFSNREKAQEYIDNHKSKYSLNDVLDILDTMGYSSSSSSYVNMRSELSKLGK